MKHLASLNKFFFKYRGRFVLGVLFVAIANIFGIVPAQVVRIALDYVGDHISLHRLSSGFVMQPLLDSEIFFSIFIFILLILSMTLAKGFFMFLMRQTIIVISRYIEFDQKNEIYNHYQKLSMSFYNRNSTGDLMNRISEDVSRVRMYAGPAIMYTINLVVMFILVMYAMFHVNAKLALFVVVPLPVLSAVIYYVHDIINRKSDRVQAQLSVLSTQVQETFSGIRVVKSFAREQAYFESFGKEAESYKLLSMSLVRTNAMFMPVLLFLIGFSTIMTVWIGGNEVIAQRLSIGNIAEFVIYVNMLTWPVASLGWVVSLVQRAAASQQRINEFLNAKPEIVSPHAAPVPVKGEIEFRNVTYCYDAEGKQGVKNISFKILAGQSLAITGKTGAGKSTIAALLLRIMDPQEGEILIDGRNLQSLNLDSFRQQVGYVPQDVFLFSDSIANNILFGCNDGSADYEQKKIELGEAARKAAIYDHIMEFKEGFETVIGERGITLSGGQKQRISIARALIRKPAILVFDDCLSAVDTQTEEIILNNLGEAIQNRTSLLISHRISTVKNAADILVLDQGKIAEQGNHDSLIAINGIYASLYNKQVIESQQAGIGS